MAKTNISSVFASSFAGSYQIIDESRMKSRTQGLKRWPPVVLKSFPRPNQKKHYKITLPETNIAPENGWLEY